jgi:hypothetical protein
MQPWFSVRRLPQRWRPMFLRKLNTFLPNCIVLQYHLSVKLYSVTYLSNCSVTISPIYQTTLSQYHLSMKLQCLSITWLSDYAVSVSPIKLHSVTASPIKLRGVTVSPIKLHSVTFTLQKKGVLIVISITVSDCMNIDN